MDSEVSVRCGGDGVVEHYTSSQTESRERRAWGNRSNSQKYNPSELPVKLAQVEIKCGYPVKAISHPNHSKKELSNVHGSPRARELPERQKQDDFKEERNKWA